MLFLIGKHVINLFIQYTPYSPLDGSWGDLAYRVSYTLVTDALALYCFLHKTSL